MVDGVQMDVDWQNVIVCPVAGVAPGVMVTLVGPPVYCSGVTVEQLDAEQENVGTDTVCPLKFWPKKMACPCAKAEASTMINQITRLN